MAKAVKIKIKLESSAGTGSFYLAEKNPRTHPEKLVLKKFDKKSKKHEEFSYVVMIRALCKVSFDILPSYRQKGNQTFFIPFTSYAKELALGIYIADIDRQGFGDTQTAAVE